MPVFRRSLTGCSPSVSQDTNTMQYELMKAIAIRRCVTIVGDPDQSSNSSVVSPFELAENSFISLWLALSRGHKPFEDAKRCCPI